MDITKRNNGSCPLKKKCLRWTAMPRITYTTFIPNYKSGKIDCDKFINNDTEPKEEKWN